MGRSKRFYLIALLLLSTSVSAQMPAHIDSLVKFTSYTLRINVPVGDTAVWRWAVNTSLQNVCAKFDALPYLDTILLRGDSTGAALNTDFLRLAYVMKLEGDIWVPMGEVRGDTIYQQIVSEEDATLKEKVATEPRLYFTHGVAERARIFTHPKYDRDTLAQEFVIAYWARDIWLRDTSPDSAAITDANVKTEYLFEVVTGAGQIIIQRRMGIGSQ